MKFPRCRDGLCGALDCPRCHPENFRGGIYLDPDQEETTEPMNKEKPHETDRRYVPPAEKRVRLAGGPFVKPATRAKIKRLSETHECSIGEVIDEYVEQAFPPTLIQRVKKTR